MGNRSHLQAYFREDRFKEKERNYYKQYMNSTLNKTGYKKLAQLAKDIRDVWNDNFGYFGDDDVPYCDSITINSATYFVPDINFTKGFSLHWEKRGIVPDYFLVLFSIDEFKDRHEIRGCIYNNKRFYTTVKKALERINNREITLSRELYELKKALKELPEESILELDFSEVIKSKYTPNYYDLNYYLNRVKELSRSL